MYVPVWAILLVAVVMALLIGRRLANVRPDSPPRYKRPNRARPTPERSRNTQAALQDPHVQTLRQNGQKIEAIKRERELTGLGLKEAKVAVEG